MSIKSSTQPTAAVLPQIEHLTTRAAGRRLVTVTAAPGWGKSTFAAAWADELGGRLVRLSPADHDVHRLTARLTGAADLDAADVAALAAHIADTTSPATPWLVLDDVHHVLATPAEGLLAALVDESAAPVRLLVTSRVPTALVDADSRAGGHVRELGAPQLRLHTEQVAGWLARELDDDNSALAARVAGVTAGWPAAVRLIIDALHDVPPTQRPVAVAELTGPGGPIEEYVHIAVLSREDDDTRRVLAQLALAQPVSTTQLAAMTGRQPGSATTLRNALVTRGLAVDTEDGRCALPPVLTGAVLEKELPERADRDGLTQDVVAALLDGGQRAAALTVLSRTGHVRQIAQLLEDDGEQLIRQGALAAVSTAADTLPAELRTPTIERLHGHALAYRGEWAAALRCVEAAGAGGDGPLPAPLAAVLGHLHHLRGDLEEAITAYSRGEPDEADPAWPALLALRSTAHWLRGDVEECARWARRAHDAAAALEDDHALALAHTALAMAAATRGDRRANRAHYDQALQAATQAGDELQRARLLNNLGSYHLERAEYDEARRLVDDAIELAEDQGYAMMAGVARCNRAEIGTFTGAIENAVVDAMAARHIFARIGSRLEAYAHGILGDLRREQGDIARARIAYEQALQLAEPTGDPQGTVPALIGLSRALAGTDPEAAQAAAARAIAADDGMMAPECLVAAAWADLAAGEREQAAALAEQGRAEAQRRESRHALTEALTLQAVLDPDPIPLLEEAARSWWSLGAGISATRVELGIARRQRPTADSRRAARAERRLQEWGCSPDGASFAHRMVSGAMNAPKVTIRALGAFTVERSGGPLPRSAWGSRKARDLLKILVAYRDRPLTREELADLLWPDLPYAEVTNRLSIALSVLRSALVTEDDGKDLAPVIADGDRVALDTARIDLDVDQFQRAAEHGLEAARAGEPDTAVEALGLAAKTYTGDLFEDDRDAHWFSDRREELRSLYLSMMRALATLVADADPDRALRLWLRVLDRDAYDEQAHHHVCRLLAHSGRHGEARRRHRIYAYRMDELDLPAVPLSAMA